MSGSAVNLTWSGDGAGNVWNNSASNWNSNAEKFFDLDPVTFDDSGAANPAVTLSGTLSPASVTVSAFNNYTLAGSGKISGHCGLTMQRRRHIDHRHRQRLHRPDRPSDRHRFGQRQTRQHDSQRSRYRDSRWHRHGSRDRDRVSGGTLAPGISIGTLTISNNLVLSSSSSSVFEANMDSLTMDKVVGLGKVTFGGTLNLNLSGRAVAAGDTFKLFSAAHYSGSFASIVPSEPGPNLVWNTSTLITDGTLRVKSTLALPTLTAQIDGNQLNLSWPSENIGWRLQAQTNSASVGISTNWTDVTGSEGSNNVSVTIHPGNATVFYRLISPP